MEGKLCWQLLQWVDDLKEIPVLLVLLWQITIARKTPTNINQGQNKDIFVNYKLF